MACVDALLQSGNLDIGLWGDSEHIFVHQHFLAMEVDVAFLELSLRHSIEDGFHL